MPQTLRYSDLKGRTDLVGRKLKFDDGYVAVIKEINEHAVILEGSFIRYNYPGFGEIIDEEPAMWTKVYRDIVCRCGKKEDARTEITWENATMDDLVYEHYLLYEEDGIHKSAPIDGKTSTVREYLREKVVFVQPNEKPIKVTHSQVEEKIGRRVEIVD